MTEGSDHRRRKSRTKPASSGPTFQWSKLTVSLTGAGVVLAALVIFQGLRQVGALQATPSMNMGRAWAALADRSAARDPAAAVRFARLALDQDPLQSGALSLLAAVEDEAGRKEKAAILMTAAARQSRRNDAADYYLFNTYMDAGKYEQALLHADALLRRRFVSLGPSVYPRILQGFNDPAFVDALAARLAKKPEWRSNFLIFANQKFSDPDTAFAIYAALQKAGSAPTSDELAPYLQRLLGAERYEKAYLSWIIFLPPSTISRLTNVYDGGFDDWPEAHPFGWELGEGIRGSAEPSTPYGRPGKALMLDFDGLRLPRFPGQTLVLSPGPYRFTGVVMTVTPESAGRIAWTISCNGKVLLDGAPAPDTKQAWVKFSADFTVPETCKGQRLQLKPIPAERRSSIEVWYDDLAIERIQSNS